MTRDDIIRMLQECGFGTLADHPIMTENMMRFAALIAAEKDKEIKRLQDMLYEQLGELTALRAEKQMRTRIEQLKGRSEP